MDLDPTPSPAAEISVLHRTGPGAAPPLQQTQPLKAPVGRDPAPGVLAPHPHLPGPCSLLKCENSTPHGQPQPGHFRGAPLETRRLLP